jgi:hypothetical protein
VKEALKKTLHLSIVTHKQRRTIKNKEIKPYYVTRKGRN